MGLKTCFGCLAACLIIWLAACATGNDEDTLRSVPLAETALIGGYDLVDYLFEYGDGARLDPFVLKITGTLSIGADSAYLESIRVGNDSTPTKGKITQVKLNGNRDGGELRLTLDGSDSAAGTSVFSFRHDTLMLVTEVSKQRDVAKKGFRETAYYLPRPAPPGG